MEIFTTASNFEAHHLGSGNAQDWELSSHISLVTSEIIVDYVYTHLSLKMLLFDGHLGF